MNAHAMTLPAATDTLPSSGQPDRVTPRLTGMESTWVLTALAAAPWPLFCGLALLGVPGPHAARTPWSFWTDGPPAGHLLHGPLAVAAALGVAGVWAHGARRAASWRWGATLLGMGTMGELVANALTDMGRSEAGLAELPVAGRALLVWVTAVALFELTPILASAAGLRRDEPRRGAFWLTMHGLFMALAGLAAVWGPTASSTGARWFVSPWLAAAVVLPAAAARFGPPRAQRLPAPAGRAGPLWALAWLGWFMTAGLVVAEADSLATLPGAWRFGLDPRASVLLVAPALACLSALLAAADLLWDAHRSERALSGTVLDAADGGFTLERVGSPAHWIALEDAPLPEVGREVTLLGARPAAHTHGPFRDGASKWRARRVWTGPPNSLASALRRRAAGWLGWAAVSLAGGVAVALALAAR